MKILLLAAALLISGPAVVLDGDTVVVAGVHIRLKGVDAPELGYPLGDAARQVMVDIIGDSELTCRLTGERTWRREAAPRPTASTSTAPSSSRVRRSAVRGLIRDTCPLSSRPRWRRSRALRTACRGGDSRGPRAGHRGQGTEPRALTGRRSLRRLGHT